MYSTKKENNPKSFLGSSRLLSQYFPDTLLSKLNWRSVSTLVQSPLTMPCKVFGIELYLAMLTWTSIHRSLEYDRFSWAGPITILPVNWGLLTVDCNDAGQSSRSLRDLCEGLGYLPAEAEIYTALKKDTRPRRGDCRRVLRNSIQRSAAELLGGGGCFAYSQLSTSFY